ncbi:pro-sigmaK processing inhibitor BofA family protein [Clostridium sp. BJN0001]|uniref:pro-sigmaK processing inhibitor BofA family protein n=1 Tax=Clostridium sp. BJN0001 TaxID=2930219 RepID=UPI001FD502F2|nr:pro-sigmaK processing inhibitor BofA family protein [Clostridium sp. BJN0001]
MGEQYLIYGLAGILLLYVFIKFIKWPIKILLNGVIGVIMLFAFNFAGSLINFSLPINAITALIAGFLGIPGIIMLIVIQLFM